MALAWHNENCFRGCPNNHSPRFRKHYEARRIEYLNPQEPPQNSQPLTRAEAGRAVEEPMKAAGVVIDAAALDEIFRMTKGYPYFLQEWGYQTWNLATSSPISEQVAQAAAGKSVPRLDANFFRARYQRLTPNETRTLRAMADLGPGPHRTADVAERLGILINSMGPVRAQLIRKGMIYSPAHGELAFTVPLFDEFMLRQLPTFE